jgi:carboxyl-terminal processing protease
MVEAVRSGWLSRTHREGISKKTMTSKTRLSVLFLSTPVLAFVVVGGFMGNAAARTGDEKFQHLRVFEDVVRHVLSNYVEEVQIDRAMEGALRGLAESLDPDSAYLNAKQTLDVESGAALPDGDVGLELTRQFYLRVIAARDDSPAAAAGLQTGDFVRGIDGMPTRDMSVFEGTRLLRGQPGSKVVLTIIRGNAAEPHEVSLVRQKTPGPAVSGRLISLAGRDMPAAKSSDTGGLPLLSGEAGYVRVASFRTGVVEDLKKQIADLSRSGAKSLIIDLRRTAEGPLDNGIAAARLFVKSGTLAITAGRDGDGKQTVEARSGDGAITLPVQILITTGTSGAAELFAAALSGNKRAELIGEQTIGRAALQKLVKLPESRGLWLTYVRYHRPGGDAIQAKASGQQRVVADPSDLRAPKPVGTPIREVPIHGKGLHPDVEVDDADTVEFGAARPDKDPILDAAIDRLRKKA